VKQQKLDKEGANDSSLASWLWPTGAPTEWSKEAWVLE
jgi:hypothetical protein